MSYRDGSKQDIPRPGGNRREAQAFAWDGDRQTMVTLPMPHKWWFFKWKQGLPGLNESE